MDIILPRKTGEESETLLKNADKLVIVGANGAGKSLFGSEIEKRYFDRTFKISALNTICPIDYDKPVHPDSIGAEYARLFNEKSHIRVKTEFEQLFAILQREELEDLIKYKEDLSRGRTTAKLPESKLDRTQALWERIFPQSKLVRRCDTIEIVSGKSGNSYNAMEMSHGEKVVFYLIASSFIARPESIIVVDEPEMHLHPSMTSALWDDIEALRPDCTFIYLTHDLNFAVSRNSKRIWVKSYDAETGSFDYEFIENPDKLPEEIYLELLGGRKPVLFIEGDSVSSIDSRLYPLVFTDWTIKPLGGCNKVIEVTKAFSEMKSFHLLESRGIVDRDRRTSHEIEYLRSKNIYVPDVAEVENILMLEPIVRTVARRTGNDEDEVFNTVKRCIIKFFKADIKGQALLHTRHRIRNGIVFRIDTRVSTIEEFAKHVEHLTEEIDPYNTYNKLLSKFKRYVNEGNYRAVLRFFNQKSMINQSRVTQLCGFATTDKYINYVISLLRENSDDSEIIRKAVKECFQMESTEPQKNADKK